MPSEPKPCPGCGLEREPSQGPTHAYIGASPGCWGAYTELIAVGAGPLAVDTYAVQHPGLPERRAIQSVCVHLMSLCAALERGWPSERAPFLLRTAVQRRLGWRWLDPRLPIGTLTVADVAVARNADDRRHLMRLWAEDLWAAYAPHHELVRGWLSALTGPTPAHQ